MGSKKKKRGGSFFGVSFQNRGHSVCENAILMPEFAILTMKLTLVLQTVFIQCSETCSYRVKMLHIPLSSSFPFILANKFEPTTFSEGGRGVGKLSKSGGQGVMWSHDFKIWLFWKYLKWCALQTLFARKIHHFLTYLAKNSMKMIACFYDFFT